MLGVIGQIEENQEEIRNMLTYIFKGVFVHRYRCESSPLLTSHLLAVHAVQKLQCYTFVFTCPSDTSEC